MPTKTMARSTPVVSIMRSNPIAFVDIVNFVQVRLVLNLNFKAHKTTGELESNGGPVGHRFSR